MKAIFFFCMMIICSQLPAQYNKIYYPSGLLQYSYELKDGGLHGDFISYYDNGLVKAKGSFINNQKTGIWLSWDSSGILRSKRSFQNDRAFDVINECLLSRLQRIPINFFTINGHLTGWVFDHSTMHFK